ncbi:hypothetical protein [Nocardia sp. NBC_00416]|uniref:hypothetical protein n=1 Tax=Nocardia sp. NBC_00416 TaxID=2975991 RepID=UPI002E1A4F9B
MAQQGQPDTAGTGADPAYVRDREVFDAYTHQQIWDRVHQVLAPAELRRLADTWGATATAVESAFDDFARDITRFSGDWSGLAAAAAARAVAAFVEAGDDSVAVSRVVEQLIAADSTAAESVRAAIPPPPAPYLPDPDPAVEAAEGARRRTAYNTTAAALTADAQDAMAFNYNPTIPASGDNVPRFAAPGPDSPEDRSRLGGPGRRAAPAAPNSDAPRVVEDHDPPAAAPAGSEAGDRSSVSDIGPEDPDGAASREFADSEPAPPVTAPDTETYAPQPDSSPADPPAPAAEETTEPVTSEQPVAAADPPAEISGTDAASDSSTTDPSATEPAATGPAAVGSPTVEHPIGSPGLTEAQPRSQPAGPVAGVPPGTGTGTGTGTGGSSTPYPEAAGRSGHPAGAPGPSSTSGGPLGPSSPAAAYRPGTASVSLAPAAQPSAAPSGSESRTATAPEPSGHTEPVARPRPPGSADREPLGTASAAPDTSPAAERAEHPGTRSFRPGAPSLPAPPAGGAVPSRGPDRERPSPDYLHAPNEELTATRPAVPPVLGEYTEAERPDRTGPGGGTR